VAIKPEENGDLLYGETFLTVLAAPHAAPTGDALLASTNVWLGLKTLGPVNFKMDLNDEMQLIACYFSAVQLSFVDNLDCILDS
jgi:hypothetical protein